MNYLVSSSELWGNADIIESDPELQIAKDVIFMPYCPGACWGVFREDGSRVEATINYREGSLVPADQSQDPPADLAAIAEKAPHSTYIYGGHLNPHYGHFIINTLPRFWAMAAVRSPSTPIIYHGGGSPADWFRLPFAATIFGLLGLRQSDFIQIDRPLKLRNLVIPCTSFEEQHVGYRAFGHMCASIGRRVRTSRVIDASERPAYFSKSRLGSAVGIVTNEKEMEPVLKAAGVDIFYPETMTFIDQVALMTSRDNILGTSGSFFHTSIFCPPRKITCLNVSSQINSNYTIIDKLNKNDAKYYYPPAMEVLNQKPKFLTARYLPEAAAVAEELLAFMRLP